jgi:hypothetical protein
VIAFDWLVGVLFGTFYDFAYLLFHHTKFRESFCKLRTDRFCELVIKGRCIF